MKWYRFKNELYNLNSYSSISKNSSLKDRIHLIFVNIRPGDYDVIIYGSVEERDAEFEKICKLHCRGSR